MTNKKLMALAAKARERAYSPYSHYSVGAALLADDGSVYLGCNIENAAYSPTVCAERVAFFSAVADGKRSFSAIAICGGKSGEKSGDCTPCGVCRQVMSEFCSADFKIIVEVGGEICEITLGELLPHSFSL